MSKTVLASLAGVSRYDLVLLSIPCAFLVSVLLYSLLSVSFEGALLGGGLLALPVLVDALYLNPPSGRTGGRASL